MSKSYGGLAREQGATRRVHYSAANDNRRSGVQAPANDNVTPDIYKSARAAAVAYYADRAGRYVGRYALPFKYINLAEDVGDYVAAAANPTYVIRSDIAQYFQLVCANRSIPVTHQALINGVPAALCGVGGQALGAGYPLDYVDPPGNFGGGANRAYFLTRRSEVAPGQYRHQIAVQWQRSVNAYNPGGKFLTPRPNVYLPVSVNPTVNPNLMRMLPSQPLVTVPVPDPAPTSSVPSAQIWSSSAPRVRVGVSPRRPAENGTKERKALSKGQALSIALFRALDQVSEAAEIVDAFFEALPKDVQKRWSKDRPNRQFLDAAGQYGIDGADWKMQAIYYNWDKVDLDQAVKNVIWNHYEDKLYGAIHRNLPRNTVNALSPGERQIAEAISELRDWLEW